MIPPGGSTAPPRETFGGATVNELAHEGIYQNSRLSFVVLQRLIDELAAVSCAPELYMTPFREFPDHHVLVFCATVF